MTAVIEAPVEQVRETTDDPDRCIIQLAHKVAGETLWIVCGAKATATITTRCECGHHETAPVCDTCLAKGKTHGLYCSTCPRQSLGRHTCKVTVISQQPR